MTGSIRALSIHADYGCRHSGVCCTAGWSIPVEPPTLIRLRGAIREGRLPVTDERTPFRAFPDQTEVGQLMGADAHGRCHFFEPQRGNLCAIHRVLGPEALPHACRQFPRMAVLTPAGVSITLSHYCPTAAGMLFREDVSLEVVRDPAAFPADVPYEGLDCREAFPPLLRPGVLMDWETHQLWEEHAVAAMARDELSPEEAVAVVMETAEKARRWSPAEEFGPFFADVLGSRRGARSQRAPWPGGVEEALRLREIVAESVPGWLTPGTPGEDTAAAHARWVEPAWPRFRPPVRRYLAARAFASWTAFHGHGLRTAAWSLAVALAVVHVEAARQCASAGRALDAALLKEAFRSADLLLVHLVRADELARRLSAGEGLPAIRP